MAIPEIEVEALAELIEAGPVRLVDVREPAEYADSHLPGAVLVPLGSVPDRLDAFESGSPTYLVCRSGARSMRACEFLAERGLDVVNVAGGTMAWTLSGRPVETGAA